MGSSRFPESGMKAVLEVADFLSNADRYINAVEQLNRADDQAVKSGSRLQKGISGLGRAFQSAGSGLRTTTQHFRDVERSTNQAGLGISRFTSRVLTIQGVLSITRTLVNAFQSVNNAIGDLGRRASEIQSVSAGFESVTRTIGGAESVMGQLRDQSQGMVSDLDLMRVANVALINSTQEFTDIVGQNFGTVVQAAFAGAAATGQDLEIVLEKVTRGLRRQSNLLLDDIGIWVVAEEANARYAASLGLTASQLTVEQTQAAFATEAIRQMGDVIAASGFSFNSMAAQSAMASAQMANDMNQLAINAQAGVQGFQIGFAQIGTTITGALAQLDPTPFFQGGANIIAALAEGILAGLTLVVQAITVVAQTIANFLSGLSPPKEGPLSKIDIGGMNVIEAWLSKFDQVSLGPVVQLAQAVADILGSTEAMTTEQQIGILEATQTRLESRLKAAVAGLGRGEARGEEVRALDTQRKMILEQLRLLQERRDLERLFGGDGGAIQSAIGGMGGGAGGAGGAGGGTDGAIGATGILVDELEKTDDTTGGTASKLDDINEKLKANAVLTAQAAAAGLDTNEHLQDRRRLLDQLAQEQAVAGQDATATLQQIAAIDAQIAAVTGGAAGGIAGGVAGGATGGAGGVGGAPDLAGYWDNVAGGAETATTGIERTLARVTEAINTFGGVVAEAVSNFENINLFGAVADLFTRLSEITTPWELVTFIAGLGVSLLMFPAQLVRDLAAGLGDLFGIELPDWLVNGLQVIATLWGFSLGMSAVAGAVTLAKTAFFALIGALNLANITLAAAAIGAVFLVNRFGSIPAALEEIGTRIEEIALTIEAQALEAQAAVATVLGGDLTAINEARARNASRRTAIQLRDILIEEIDAIVNDRALSLTPMVQMALEEDRIDVPQTVVLAVQNRLQNTLAGGDALAIGHAIELARVTGVTVPLEVQAGLEEAIEREIAAGNLDIRAQVSEVQSRVAGVVVLVDEEARQYLRDTLGEAAAAAWDGTPVELNRVIALPVPGSVILDQDAQTILRDDLQQQIDAALANMTAHLTLTAWPDIGPPTTTQQTGGGPLGKAVGGRGKPGGVGGEAVNKPGAGGDLFADMIASIEAVGAALEASQMVWNNYGTTVTITSLNAVTQLDTILVKVLDTNVAEETLNTTTTLLDSSYTTFNATLATMTQTLMSYNEDVTESIQLTNEFRQAILALPSHVSVIIDTIVNIVNMTSLGAAIAAEMQDQDIAAIGGYAAGGPFRPGQMFLVGENGPELIVSGRNSGQVIPIAAPPLRMNVLPAPVMMGGGATVNQTINGPTDAGANMRRLREMAALGVFG